MGSECVVDRKKMGITKDIGEENRRSNGLKKKNKTKTLLFLKKANLKSVGKSE